MILSEDVWSILALLGGLLTNYIRDVQEGCTHHPLLNYRDRTEFKHLLIPFFCA